MSDPLRNYIPTRTPSIRTNLEISPEIAVLKSPIEWLFGQGLLRGLHELQSDGWSTLYIPAGEITAIPDFPPVAPGRIVVASQIEIGSYVADFLVIVRHAGWHPCRVAIECDGHDFHERTPEQAQHDKARDRYFFASYVYPVRYAGSEIVADPRSSAADALQLAINLASPEVCWGART